MLITPLFAALFGLMYVALTVNVSRHRISKRISLGSGGDSSAERAIRAHANFIEYVPLSLLLFYFIEILTLSSSLVFLLASTLFVARILHILGMLLPYTWIIFRQIGAMITFVVIIIASVSLALRYVPISV